MGKIKVNFYNKNNGIMLKKSLLLIFLSNLFHRQKDTQSGLWIYGKLQ